VDTIQGVFDADTDSTARMSEALAMWNSLPTVINNKLTWKRADNSLIALTQAELQAVHDEVKLKRAVRAATLHMKAEVYTNQTVLPTLIQLSSLEYWLEV
jgi:hypothetical protein